RFESCTAHHLHRYSPFPCYQCATASSKLMSTRGFLREGATCRPGSEGIRNILKCSLERQKLVALNCTRTLGTDFRATRRDSTPLLWPVVLALTDTQGCQTGEKPGITPLRTIITHSDSQCLLLPDYYNQLFAPRDPGVDQV